MARKKKTEDAPQQPVVVPSGKEQKLARIREIMEEQNKKYAKSGGMTNSRAGGRQVVAFMASEMSVSARPTGWAKYDKIMGGEPIGRPVVDYGPTGSGKSTVNYWKIAKFQETGNVCAVVNAEGGFDPDWARICGVNLDELLVIDQGDTLEETAQRMWDTMKLQVLDHILIDSIHGQLTKKEMYKSSGNNDKASERAIEDDTVGALALKLTSLLRRITPVLGKSNCSLTIIGQARTDIGSYGAPISLTGGHALKHFARRICRWTRAAKSEWPREGGKEGSFIGFTSRVDLELQQINQYEREFFFVPFRTGTGVWESRIKVDEMIEDGRILGKGSFWSFTETNGTPKTIQGKDNLYRYFENPSAELLPGDINDAEEPQREDQSDDTAGSY